MYRFHNMYVYNYIYIYNYIYNFIYIYHILRHWPSVICRGAPYLWPARRILRVRPAGRPIVRPIQGVHPENDGLGWLVSQENLSHSFKKVVNYGSIMVNIWLKYG